MRERDYQPVVIKRLMDMFPDDSLILKNDSGYLQGVPDIVIFYRNRWAMLEVKASKDAALQPNQKYYVDRLNDMSFAAFIYPENEEEVLRALQRSFETDGHPCLPQRQQVPLAQVRRREADKSFLQRKGGTERRRTSRVRTRRDSSRTMAA